MTNFDFDEKYVKKFVTNMIANIADDCEYCPIQEFCDYTEDGASVFGECELNCGLVWVRFIHGGHDWKVVKVDDKRRST